MNMKAWEMTVKESKKNLWLVTTKCKKFLCSKVEGEFFIKAPVKLIIREHQIVEACKL